MSEWGPCAAAELDLPPGVIVGHVEPSEDIFAYIERVAGRFDPALYLRLLGAANEFKEGDAIVGVSAADETARLAARQLLANTPLSAIDLHAPHRDELCEFVRSGLDPAALGPLAQATLGELKAFLLAAAEAEIHQISPGLSSDVIGCLVKLMSNAELTQLGANIFNALPGSQIGARGYLGARVQPNSPTDNVDDIRWQVFDAFAYAVGDVLLGTNPVSSEPASVLAVEQTLQEVLLTFGIDHLLPHCVLSHIDVQAQVEEQQPGSTELWFQSIAGTDAANATFDVSVDKMVEYARQRRGRFGLYFETGQGADFTNGHAHGFDMVLHESRKYGLTRQLARQVAIARGTDWDTQRSWVHVNDVAGFIGPEVFRTREQLVRCCLEDIVMGKLHGLTIGLDVCSTLHMDVTLDDLDWCLEQVAPACPAYLMALPTKIDPMLGYLTTGYQDHVRLREQFGFRVNDGMWQFFQELGVIDAAGQPTKHFGDPAWVYLQFCRRQGDGRSDAEILAAGKRTLQEIDGRGVFIAKGFGKRPSQLAPQLRYKIEHIYQDSKRCLWVEWNEDFIAQIPQRVVLQTTSEGRLDYILRPTGGEQLLSSSLEQLGQLRQQQAEQYNVQIVVSEGLNALAVMDEGQLQPLLRKLRSELAAAGYRLAPETIVVKSGRVRAGYRIGQSLFAGIAGERNLIHIIGERPGSGHHTLSAYLTTATGEQWQTTGAIDHNITKVVSGIATTALAPEQAAVDIRRVLTS
ncbi:Ethanolamine ammonia-lyase heavy chain [Aureliella helgolandensis]|uniref:Ethanolamine ammonia-lyase heavy chain n=2 Tax=Aureliella helgolandensis TaxID=2527968 RepID=A0A518GHC4_9BACT|nr:Ethanolamine ammonia-lyase heavy chain [Aureliella helgolandensis]